MPRAESQLHAPSARHTCRAVPPTALCRPAGVPLQALGLTPTTRAAPPFISLGRSRSSRRSSRPSDSARPTLPCPVRAGRVAPFCVDLPLARPDPRQPAPPHPPNPRPTTLHKRTPHSPHPCGSCAGSGRRSRRSSLRSRPSSSRRRPSDEPPLLLRRYSGEHLFRP